MNDEELFSRLRMVKCKGEDTSSFNYFDFLHAKGSPFDALFYSRLFWPEFIEYKGMFFLKETIEDEDDEFRIDRVLKENNGDTIKTEQTFNLIEVPSLFGKRLAETTDKEDITLTERLIEMWSYRLHMLYPERKFEVKLLTDKETGGEIALSFYSKIRE